MDPLDSVRTLLLRVGEAGVRQRIEKTLVLWELGYLREALSQFRVLAEGVLRRVIRSRAPGSVAASLEQELDRGRATALVARLHDHLELIPSRVGLQLYTLLAWGNYASHHQKRGHQARASDLAVLLSIAVDLLDWASVELDGGVGVFEGAAEAPEPPRPEGEALSRWDRGSTLERVTRFVLQRCGAQAELSPHRLLLPALALELIWSRPPGPAPGGEPYRGLRSFEPEDAERFFGRDELRRQLEHSVDTRRLTVLSGASGAGKTSLLRAGLIPLLLDLGCGVLQLSEYTAEGLELAGRVVDAWQEGPLVLVLDQLERALLPGVPADTLAACMKLLLLVGRGRQGLRVVAGIREEYLGTLLRECQVCEPAGEAEGSPSIVVAGPLGERECREAITRPLEGSGLSLSPELLAALLPELQEEGGGAIPSKLQIVCSRLVEAARDRGSASLDLPLYRELGGAGRILQTYLDQALSSGKYRGEQELARGLLKAMTGPQVRRWESPARLWLDLQAGSMLTDEVQLRSLLGRLMDDRLVASRRGSDGVARYSLMHDQLAEIVRAWRSPVELEQEEARDHVQRALACWPDPGRRELLRGRALALVERCWPGLRLPGEQKAAAATLLRVSRGARRRVRAVAALLLAAALLGLLFGGVQLRQAVRERDRAVQLADLGVTLQAQQDLERDPTLAAARLRNLSQEASGVGALALVEEARRRGVAVVLVGHTDLVNGVAFSPDSRLLASASRDGTVRLWDVPGWGPLGPPLRGHGASVQRVAFAPDGRTLASASLDGTVRRWEAPSGRPLGTVGLQGGGVRDLCFSPDGRLLAWAGEDPFIQVWDLKKRGPWGRLGSEEGGFLTLAITPDGAQLAAGAAEDRRVSFWRLDRPPGEPWGYFASNPGGSTPAMALSPDGKRLVLPLSDNGSLWPMAVPVDDHGSAGLPQWRAAMVPGKRVLAMAHDPLGSRVACACEDKVVRFWDLTPGSAGWDPDRTLRGHGGAVHHLAFSPGGRLLATASRDHTIRLWDLTARRRTDARVHARLQAIGEVWSLAYVLGGRRLVTGGTTRHPMVWDLTVSPPRPQVQPLRPGTHGEDIYAVAVAPSGRAVAAAGWKGRLSLWDLDRQGALTLRHRLDLSPRAIYSLAFSRDGQRLWAGGSDGTVQGVRLEAPVAAGPPLQAHQGAVLALARRPGSDELASGSRGGEVRLWSGLPDHPRGRLLGLHGDAVYSLAFSPDGRTLASGSGDSTLRLWDADSGQPRGHPQSGHHHWVLSLAFSPDGRTLASGSSDSTLRLWDARALRAQGPAIHGHLDWIHTLQFSPDGRTLASGSADRTVTLWQLSESRLQRIVQRIDALTNLQVSLEGRVTVK